MPPARDCIPRRVGPVLLLTVILVEFAALLALNILAWALASTGSIAVILAAPFLLYLALDACWKKNTIQLIALYLLNTALLVYVVLQFVETRAKNVGLGWVTVNGDWSALDDILAGVQLAVVAVAQVLLAGAGWLSFREYHWTIFSVIGNEKRLRTAFRGYHIYLCFLKLTFFFIFYQIVTQFTGDRRGGSFLSPFLGLIIDVVICVVLVLEWVGLRWERRWLLWTILLFNVLATAWLALAVVALDYSVHNYNETVDYYNDRYSNSSPFEDLRAIKYSNLIWYHLTLALYLARFILSCVCWQRIPRGIYTWNVQNNLRRQGGGGGDAIAMEEARELGVGAPVADETRARQHEGFP